MDRVAEPAPSLAFTTSSPPNWTPVIRSQHGRTRQNVFGHTIDQSVKFVPWNVSLRLGLAEQRHDCLPRVTANNWNCSRSRISLSRDFRNEGLGPNDI